MSRIDRSLRALKKASVSFAETFERGLSGDLRASPCSRKEAAMIMIARHVSSVDLGEAGAPVFTNDLSWPAMARKDRGVGRIEQASQAVAMESRLIDRPVYAEVRWAGYP